MGVTLLAFQNSSEVSFSSSKTPYHRENGQISPRFFIIKPLVFYWSSTVEKTLMQDKTKSKANCQTIEEAKQCLLWKQALETI